MSAGKGLDKNPMLGLTPGETIEHVVGALSWLAAMDPVAEEALGGVPIDTIKFGRYLLGQCCIGALKAAGGELDEIERRAKKPASRDMLKVVGEETAARR